MESNSDCNHASDDKIGRPRSGSAICLSINHKNYYFREKKRKVAKLCDKGKFYLSKTDKGCINLGACTLFL